MTRFVGSCALLIILSGSAVLAVAEPVRFLAQDKDQRSVSPYEFLSTTIDCLARAHDSVTAINGQASDDFIGKMTAMLNGNIELYVSERMVEPFTTSRDDRIKAASDTMLVALAALRTSFEIQHALYEKVDSATSAGALAGLGSSISHATDLYEESSTLLIVAATAIGSAVVQDRGHPQDHVALLLSDEESSALVKTLKSRFDAKLATTTNGYTGPMQAAKVMLTALDQPWRVAK